MVVIDPTAKFETTINNLVLVKSTDNNYIGTAGSSVKLVGSEETTSDVSEFLAKLRSGFIADLKFTVVCDGSNVLVKIVSIE